MYPNSTSLCCFLAHRPLMTSRYFNGLFTKVPTSHFQPIHLPLGIQADPLDPGQLVNAWLPAFHSFCTYDVLGTMLAEGD